MKRNLYDLEMDIDENTNNKVILVERNPIPNGIALVNSNKIAKKVPNDLVELAVEIQKADQFVNATVCNKLQVIADQIRFLQNQAQQILEEEKINSVLHHAACNFKKIPGNTYYLYKRPSGQTYFSMLSPKEWTNPPHEFLGGYRLEADYSWTPETNIKEKDSNNIVIRKLMSSNNNQNFVTLALQDSPMEEL